MEIIIILKKIQDAGLLLCVHQGCFPFVLHGAFDLFFYISKRNKNKRKENVFNAKRKKPRKTGSVTERTQSLI